MDLNTLTLYLIAGGVSLSLSLVLLVFAHYQPAGGLMKRCAVAILMASAAFTVSGFGPDLPRWMTVIGSNMLLIAAAQALYTGFANYCAQRPMKFDRLGWAVVAITALPFWYWGLVEPNGNFRSAVYSGATSVITARTAIVLLRRVRAPAAHAALWWLALIIGIGSAWMAGRFAYFLVIDVPPPALRGANPTLWITVALYIVLMTMVTAAVIWLALWRPAGRHLSTSDHDRGSGTFSFVGYFRNRLLLLWATVLILLLGLVGEAGVFYAKFFDWERERLTSLAKFSNDALAHHSGQVISQIDTLLHSVRNFYLYTQSAGETDRFIDSLPIDKSIVDNIYLIDAVGQVVVTHQGTDEYPSVADRDYFQFHQSHAADEIFISSVEVGRITGKLHFRTTRRINRPDGSFDGVILATVNPQAFSDYYLYLGSQTQHLASLLGLHDRKLRARSPMPPADRWQTPVQSPLWESLAANASGIYTNISALDDIARTYIYRKVGDLPLVMVSGYSEADLRASVHRRNLWFAVGALAVISIILTLTGLLTVEIRRGNEQGNFMSMLSHELKTPLSVMRMSLDSEIPMSPTMRAHALAAVRDMDTIIYRCLQADRLEQHGLVQDPQACQISELLVDLQTASRDPERLHIEATNLPLFHTDPQLLSIALNNLIDNALKYAQSRSVVQIRAETWAYQRRPGIRITITNAVGGAGLPDARKVFKKYYRSPGAHSSTGSGLGLFLVRNVVRLLDGTVRYAPREKWVSFELWLPL